MLTTLFNFVGLFVLLLSSSANLKLKRYDPVAYITTGKPVKGDITFEYKSMDATYRFSSQANLELFKQEPENIFRNTAATALMP